jgi:hypothetical protein
VKKIISLFQRNYEGDRLVRDEVVPGAEWVIAGEGVATEKIDGTCCLVKDGKLFKRYEVKPGRKPPVDFIPANDVDEKTGKQQGWRPVGDGPEDAYHREANATIGADGTYELMGPKVQGNPYGVSRHTLEPHGAVTLPDAPRDFQGLAGYLQSAGIEGIVWHHPDGRMVKIKANDFRKGLWPPAKGSAHA